MNTLSFLRIRKRRGQAGDDERDVTYSQVMTSRTNSVSGTLSAEAVVSELPDSNLPRNQEREGLVESARRRP